LSSDLFPRGRIVCELANPSLHDIPARLPFRVELWESLGPTHPLGDCRLVKRRDRTCRVIIRPKKPRRTHTNRVSQCALSRIPTPPPACAPPQPAEHGKTLARLPPRKLLQRERRLPRGDSGPVVIVTGGNRGIGFEICRQRAAPYRWRAASRPRGQIRDRDPSPTDLARRQRSA
jgi:hypothetical protein